jgi:hypothetical protein
MQPSWYTHQENDLDASKLIGAPFRNEEHNLIGTIDEVVFSNDGQIAVVIGVASELGFGEREVAVNLKWLRLSKDDNNLVLTLNTAKDALKNAPERTLPGECSAGGTDHTTGLRRFLLAITEYLRAALRNGDVQEAPALLPVELRCAARQGAQSLYAVDLLYSLNC